MLSATHLSTLFNGLAATLDLSSTTEITLEANPATFDFKKAKLFKSLGFNRVSLGIQSFIPHVLAVLGREHTPEQAISAIEILQNAEIPSLNIDLMFSVPGQSFLDWNTTLTQCLALGLDHISAYNLTYEEDTAFSNP